MHTDSDPVASSEMATNVRGAEGLHRRRNASERRGRKTHGMVWQYFHEQYENEKGKLKRKCKFCGHIVDALNATRAAGHLTHLDNSVQKCKAIDTEMQARFRMEFKVTDHTHPGGYYIPPRKVGESSSTPIDKGGDDGEATGGKSTGLASSSSNQVPTPQSSFDPSGGRTATAVHVTTLNDAWATSKREALDEAWAKAFYSTGMAFNIRNNKDFQDAVTRTANSRLHGYSLPSYHRLRTELLAKGKQQVTEILNPQLANLSTFGCSLSSDGWENIRRQPLMNMVVLTKGGDFFYDSWNAENEDKDHTYLARKFIGYIKEIGPANILQFITDGAAANRVAVTADVRSTFPHMQWTWCAAHVIDLLLEDWTKGNNNWLSEVFKNIRGIAKMIRASQICHGIFRKYSPKLDILLPGATRFATNYIMVERAVRVRAALKQMVVDEKWVRWAASRPKGSPDKPREFTRAKASHLKRRIISETFWEKTKMTIYVLEPIVKMLRSFDSSSPQSG